MNYIFTLNQKGIDFCQANNIMIEFVKAPDGTKIDIAIINKDIELLGAPDWCYEEALGIPEDCYYFVCSSEY
jgi:hypothetical protein